MTPNSVIESGYLSQFAEVDTTLQGERYLDCHLVPDLTVAVSVQQIAEVLTISTSSITPIPRMAPWVMGVYNWRGEVLWMMDLGHLLGLTPWYQHTTNLSSHSMLIARMTNPGMAKQAEQKMLGLVVGQVRDIETLDPKVMQTATRAVASPELAPFLKGYWLKQDGEPIVCLDVDAVFSVSV